MKKKKVVFAKKMPRLQSHVALLQSSTCNLALLRRTLGSKDPSHSDEAFAASTDLSKVQAPGSHQNDVSASGEASLRLPNRDGFKAQQSPES